MLIPGIPGLSDHITVRSLVGRFLEHSRVFWFANGGREELYIGSADWMPRNLNDRVELMVPVEEPELMARLKRCWISNWRITRKPMSCSLTAPGQRRSRRIIRSARRIFSEDR